MKSLSVESALHCYYGRDPDSLRKIVCQYDDALRQTQCRLCVVLEENRMSYSFSVKAASKEEAKSKANAEFDKVLASQPYHTADVPAARDTANKFIDAVHSEPNLDVKVDCHGSISWRGIHGSDSDPMRVSGASATINVFQVMRDPA